MYSTLSHDYYSLDRELTPICNVRSRTAAAEAISEVSVDDQCSLGCRGSNCTGSSRHECPEGWPVVACAARRTTGLPECTAIGARLPGRRPEHAVRDFVAHLDDISRGALCCKGGKRG